MANSLLVIDDSTIARMKIIDALRESALFGDYFEAANGEEALHLLDNQSIDIILCDIEMPRMDGLTFLDTLRKRGEFSHIPVILLTGEEKRETKIRGLEEGASDYLVKPFDPAELVAKVKIHLKIKMLQDSLKRSNERLLELSNTDYLTGLCNRRCLMRVMEREFQRSIRTGLPLSLVMLDIDHFKKINDTYGHQQGDEVLITLSEILRGHLREYDQAARFGGEEFAMVLPATSLLRAEQVTERMRAAVATHTFAPPLQELRLTISCGIASFPHRDVRTVDDLVRLADETLYRAKRSGRNRVETMRE